MKRNNFKLIFEELEKSYSSPIANAELAQNIVDAIRLDKEDLAEYLVSRDQHLALNITQARQLAEYIDDYTTGKKSSITLKKNKDGEVYIDIRDLQHLFTAASFKKIYSYYIKSFGEAGFSLTFYDKKGKMIKMRDQK